MIHTKSLTTIFANRSLKIVLTLTLGLLVASSVVFAVRAYNRPLTESRDPKSGNVVEPAVVSSAAQGSPQERVRAERVTVFPYGFEPDEITRPAGPFLLAVDNRAGSEALSLRLISERSGQVYAAPIPRGKSRVAKLMDLPPGRYLLSEDGHPEWACTITITPRP